MFIRILFKKYGLKENKYLMAAIYGAIYCVLFILTFVIAQYILYRTIRIDYKYIILIFFAGVVVYLIKWYFIKSTKINLKKKK